MQDWEINGSWVAPFEALKEAPGLAHYLRMLNEILLAASAGNSDQKHSDPGAKNLALGFGTRIRCWQSKSNPACFGSIQIAETGEEALDLSWKCSCCSEYGVLESWRSWCLVSDAGSSQCRASNKTKISDSTVELVKAWGLHEPR